MSRWLDALARGVTRIPRLTLAMLVAVTVALGAAASLLEVDTSVEGFAPADGRAATLDRIEDRFTTATSVQVLIDAGPGGDVITPATITAVDDLAAAIEADPDVAPVLAPEAIGQPPVVSFALPFDAAGEALDQPLEELDPATFEALARGIVADGGDEVAGLFSDDLVSDPPQARAGLLVVDLDATASSAERERATRAITAWVDRTEVGDTRRATLSILAIEEGIEAALERDLPVLLSISLLLVVLVLALLFRSVVDVLVGLAGLLGSIVWMAGFAGLLGPGGLGFTGPFTQVATAVPVLLVGLGIDYSVHLTTRYREQRRHGDDAIRSSRVALATVGVALVLATVASVAGFLANIVTPLPPIRDFGIFAAIGIVSAFVILSTAVPAARTLADRRRDAGAPAPGPDDTRSASDDPTPPAWARAATQVATRTPTLALGITFLVLLGAGYAATGLSTEFDERDFLPEGEPVLATIDRLDARFGGDVSERTFLLVDGDSTDPTLLAAVAATEDRLPQVEDVRTIEDDAERSSPLELRQRIVRRGERVREGLADDLAAWQDPEAAAADVDLPDPLDTEAFLDDLDEVELDDELREALLGRLPEGRDPLAALLATIDPAELEAEIRAGLAEGFAEGRPDELTDAAVDDLAARPAPELTLARLQQAGFPLAELDPDERERLEQLEALEAVGDVDSRDGRILAAHLDVLADVAPNDLARVLDEEGLLVAIATQAGQDGAERLAAELAAVATPIETAGGTITIVSDPLVNAEIIEELSAAQLIAIAISLAAAAALLVIATLASARVVGLGLIGIVPSVVALVLVLGAMRGVGLAFNALTATVASIAVGIGVPYGIHLTNRYREALARGFDPDGAARDALTNTGPALVGSAVTTGLAFAVLMLSNSVPIRQFGAVSTMMIVLALAACLFVQPALLVLWARRRNVTGGRRQRRRDRAEAQAGEALPVP